MDDETPPKSPFRPPMTQEIFDRSLGPISGEELMESIDDWCARNFPRGDPDVQGPPRLLPIGNMGKGWQTDPYIPNVIFVNIQRRKQGEWGARWRKKGPRSR